QGTRLHYAQQWTLIQNYTAIFHAFFLPFCSNRLLSSYSLSGDLKAVVRETSGQFAGQQFLEVWSNSSLKKIIHLTALNKHGRVYEDAQFGCLAWSTCESRLLYVAEGKRSIGESYTSASICDFWVVLEDRSMYWEDWGEGLTSKSVPVLCVADVAKGTVTVLQGVPSHVSPGQALWAHDGECVFFVGWWHEPFRLGLRFCSNRRSALFCLDLEGNCECLSGDTSSVSSPRLSPDGRYLVYLEGQVFGPHSQCLTMQQYDLEMRSISLLVDVVNRPKKDEFAGLYEALPPRCWASDSQRVVFSSARRNWRQTVQSFSLPSAEKFGSWKLLTIQNNLMVVHCSHLNEAPRLVIQYCGHLYIAPVIQVTTIQRSCHSGYHYTTLWTFRLPLYRALDIQVTTIQSSGHSGYHYTELWTFRILFLSLCVVVNYRGSTGFGQDSILSLAGNIGSQDVKDVQRAVLTALADQTAEKLLTLDPDKVVVMGGSHGGFLACHLIGQYPDFYKACAVRNPVINAATLLGTSDIVDWRYSCVGLQYSYDQLPTPEALTTMLQKSPISYAPQIKSPVLLMLGGKDRRVSPHQGLELYRSLKSRGSPVRLLWFAEDAHSLARVDTQADCFLNVVLWFQQHLHLH
uniref:acylaminoacyl-peptidase n=1 Tax=Oncorhynchus mykiss TaxID=8022 RepID=A0A8C7V1L8_ONCMY